MKKILMTLTLAVAAMIAIPATATAQDANPQEKTECCKEKKDCKKENCKKEECKKTDCKDCKKECDKPCLKKEGKGKQMKRAQAVKGLGQDRKMKGPKDARMNKQIRRGNGENPLFKGITLSDEQKTKMQALRDNNKKAEKQTKADMKAKSKVEMQKIRAEFDKEVEKILDKDQLKQYQANKAEMEAKKAEKQSKLTKIEKKDK